MQICTNWSLQTMTCIVKRLEIQAFSVTHLRNLWRLIIIGGACIGRIIIHIPILKAKTLISIISFKWIWRLGKGQCLEQSVAKRLMASTFPMIGTLWKSPRSELACRRLVGNLRARRSSCRQQSSRLQQKIKDCSGLLATRQWRQWMLTV